MLGIDGSVLSRPPKKQILTVMLQNCENSSVKYSIEKYMLFYFMDLSTVFRPSLRFLMQRLTFEVGFLNFFTKLKVAICINIWSASDFSVIFSWILVYFSTIKTGKYWSMLKWPLSVWDTAFHFRICKTEFSCECSKILGK